MNFVSVFIAILLSFFSVVGFEARKGVCIYESEDIVEFEMPDGNVFAIYGSNYEIGDEYLLVFSDEEVIETIKI